MITVVIVVAVVALLFTWVTFTAARVDRLHHRVDAARAALDAALVRRAATAHALVDRSTDTLGAELTGRLRDAVRTALDAGEADREAAENDLSGALAALPAGVDPERLVDLREASTRVVLARRFYNDAVRDTRALRGRWVPRLLRLGGRRAVPGFFEINEVTPSADDRPVGGRSG